MAENDNATFQEAAFAQALHDTLTAQVPTQQSQLDADLAATLSTLRDGDAKSAGERAGRRQAAAVLAHRAGDGLDTASVDIAWTPPPAAPGVWQPTPPSFGPAVRAGEGNARPFLLAADNQFDPGPPPSLTSATYLNDLTEVRALGAVHSTVRTAAQTDVAQFWEPATNIQYGQVLREVLVDVQRPLSWDTRFVAAFHVVTTDGQISIYNAKFEYVRWRPVTAIRTGSVARDPTWTPLFTTPSHPEYPSGHAGYAGAAQAVLTAFLGPNAPRPVSATSPTDPGATHTYASWRQVTQEILNARVWEGVHFRFSDNTGAITGLRAGGFDVRKLGSIGLNP
ncbi:MAG TPA: vanadium-dependent haloperoxidase [Pseudonocardiaceae bacterium]